jgi:hypothetical protein
MLADINGDGRQDLVGFGDAGVYVALSTGTQFNTAQLVVANFGYNQGWREEKHVRLLSDLNGDGRADIVAFGDDGVWTALSTGSGFVPPRLVLANVGYNQGWRVEKHVRLLADVNGDGRPDIVAFGNDGVWLALGDGSGGFGPAMFAVSNLGANQGWDPAKHERTVADVNGDGKDDIVAFGDDGVWTALSTGSGFAPPRFVLADLGYHQGWRQNANPRLLADIDHDGKKEIVGFGTAGVWVARSTGDGGFAPAVYVLADFGSNTWESHPRILADLNGDGYLDIVSGLFAETGSGVRPTLWRGLGGPTGFSKAQRVLIDFPGFGDPVVMGDVDGDGKQDLVDLNFRNYEGGLLLGVFTMVARSSDSSPPPPPAAPSNTRIINSTPTSLSVAWQNNAPDARYFTLTYGTSHSVSYLDLPSKRSTSVITGLVSATQYCVTLKTSNWWGVSAASSEVCGRTTTSAPSAFVTATVEPFNPGSDYRLVHIFGNNFQAGETVTLKITSQDGNSTPETITESAQASSSGNIDHKYSGSGGGVCIPLRAFTVQGTGVMSHRVSNVATTGCP